MPIPRDKWRPVDVFDRRFYAPEEGADFRGLSCKKCGSTDVRWRQQGGKWVLFSLTPGVVHTCELKADDFPNLK